MLGTTDLENHVTYGRGFYVLHPFSSDPLAQPDHTIAHELGHITLNTHNEAKAERKAQELLKETPVIL
jgi:Zn-dependent peptidase ImmA (M78 family)